ncbi:hypothetical protein [Burkholderia catarinensis]|uniref:hypothetical protein n=1 Tax=Burkholderia catarinensis TaxID=1108140 RepID=UPI001C589DC7|nr:hypothetical protein [Burkholderia catarinensis]
MSDDKTREEVDSRSAAGIGVMRGCMKAPSQTVADCAAGGRIEVVRNTERTGRPAACGMAAVPHAAHVECARPAPDPQRSTSDHVHAT